MMSSVASRATSAILRTTRIWAPMPFTRRTALAALPLDGMRTYVRMAGAPPSSTTKRRTSPSSLPEERSVDPLHQQSSQPPEQPPILEPFTDHSVQLPPETADDVIKQTGTGPQCVLQHAGFMVGRQLEMMNVLVGYEQANKYSVTDQQGRNVAFIAEEETSFLGTVVRQILGTRRSFKAAVLDVQGNVVLKVERPIKWFLNSHLAITDAHDTPIGHVNQVWHPLRRKYDLFLRNEQFGIIESGFWAWDFLVEGDKGEPLAFVNRNFAGFAREIFTDTGVYAVHVDNIEPKARNLSLDERAVVLACAINIDIDYFSRHSNSTGGFLPFLLMGAATS